MTEFALVAAITVLAVISPGPDFVMVSRNSVALSRKAGMLTAVGIGLGVLVHVAYAIIGVGLLLKKSPTLFFVFKMAGALYLIFMGITMLRSKKSDFDSNTKSGSISNLAALRIGVLTNELNPKTSIFILSLFMQVISQTTPLENVVGYGLFISATHIIWFLLVAYFLSSEVVRMKIAGMRHWIDRCFGLLLVGFGIALATMAAA